MSDARGDTRFQCPDCGGNWWRTPNPTVPAGQMMRRCDGPDGCGGCSFTWPDVDDWKYSVGIVIEEETRSFTSAEDFEDFKRGGG